MQVQGVVEKVDSFNTATGKTVFSVHLNGIKYGGMWENPNVFSGDQVSFDGVQNGQYWNVGKNSMQIIAKAAAGAPLPTPTVGAGVAAPQGSNSRDVSIVFQSSRKDALALLPVLLAQEAIIFPKSAKTADKYDALVAIVYELTVQNYMQVQDAIANGGVSTEDMVPAPQE